MGTEAKFTKVKFFSGFIYSDREIFKTYKDKLEYRLSPIDLVSEEFPFEFTDYYTEEMGSPLYRQFVSFEELISPVELPITKRFTNRLEIEASVDDKRTVNIDPGFISDANVILGNHQEPLPPRAAGAGHLRPYRIRHQETEHPFHTRMDLPGL